MNSDREIVDILQQGKTNEQNDVIRQLYEKCYPQVLDFVLKNSGLKNDCEDIFQQTMEIFYYKIQRNGFHGKSAVATYFYGIAKNLWFTELRKRKHNHVDIISDLQISDEEQILTNQNLELFYNLFDQLEMGCQQILRYFYYDNLSMNEILTKFSTLKNEQSVRTKKYRCLKYLVAIFKKNKITPNSFIQ